MIQEKEQKLVTSNPFILLIDCSISYIRDLLNKLFYYDIGTKREPF